MDKRTRRNLVWVLLLLAGTVWILARHNRPVPYQRDSGLIFGTMYNITYQHAENLKADIEAEMLRFDGSLSPFNDTAVITRVNRGEEVVTDSLFRNVFRRSMQEEMGPGSMAIALIGCAGNINHFDTRTDMNQTCYEEAKRVGTGYAETVKKALGTLKPIEGEGIQIVFGDAQAGPREISREELDEAEAICAKYPDIDVESLESTVDLTSEDLARGTPFALKYFANTLVKMANNKTPVVFHLIGFQFGKCAVLASLPSEPFIEIGLELRKGIFGGKLCLVSSHGNGTGGMTYSGGYIPNPWNYGRGGYEPTPRSNPFSMKTADILLAAWRRLAEKLN